MRGRIILKIYGRVQGVFFRASVKEKADELGLGGWVKNETDGSVEIEAEGERGQLQKFISWCRIGTELAKIERVEVEWEEAEGKFNEFEIR